MREYLFRAKRTDGKGWVKGCYTFSKKADRHLIWVQSDNDADWWHTIPVEVDRDTVGQYTGMMDKNGARIFEGDIIECWSQGVKAQGSVQQRIDGLWIIYPAYQHDSFWGLCPSADGNTSVEVVGNVYDNPELLPPSPKQHEI
jgi:uncharacterized phage protein (TIGR01671 family)